MRFLFSSKALCLFFLISAPALARDFSCSFKINQEEILKAAVRVENEELTEIHLGFYRDVEIVGTAMFTQVSTFLIFDGVTFGSIGFGQSSRNMYMLGVGELTLFCSLSP